MDNEWPPPTPRSTVWGHVVATFSQLSVAAFVISAVLHGITFKKLGLDYLQVASPSDVFMDGLDLTLRSGLFAIPAGVGFLTGLVAGSKSRVEMFVALMVAIAAIATAIFAPPTGGMEVIGPLLGAFGLGMPLGVLWGRHAVGAVPLRMDTAPLASAAVLAVGVLIAATASLSNLPYWGRGWIIANETDGMAGGNVVWSGDNALVVWTRAPDGSTVYSVIFGPENVTAKRLP